MTNIGIFHTLIHKKRHKWSLFYYLKVYNDCSFSFNSKMTFSVSQLDVVEMKNWENVLNAHEKAITEMPSDVLEHFFSGLFLWKFDVLHSKFTLKVTYLSRMSFVFSDISYLCWKFCPSFVGPFETSGALILGLTRFWSTVFYSIFNISNRQIFPFSGAQISRHYGCCQWARQVQIYRWSS